MRDSNKSIIFRWLVPCGFFTACFLYFAIVNKYLLFFQEQNQLFRFSRSYFEHFLSKPGGLSEYIGAFFVQFYLNAITGAFIVTFFGLTAFLLADRIFKKLKITGIIRMLIPVLFFVLQCDYMFKSGKIIALLLILLVFALYVSIEKSYLRLTIGVTGIIFLYVSCGSISLIAPVFFILYEILYKKTSFRIIAVSLLMLTAFIFPYFASRTIYYMPIKEIWFDPFLLAFKGITKYSLMLFLAFFVICLILKKIAPTSILFRFQSEWNRKTILAGVLVIFVFSFGIKKYVYDPKIRLFLEMDYNVQQAKWDRVIELSLKAPVTNRLILYYTNLALFKTGHLGDRIFYFNQIGLAGLWLDRDKDDISLFIGGEIFYDLGNFNEATRWAYDAMVSNGQTPPRLLKQLVLTAFVNGDMSVAEKYLNVLDESYFYSGWAENYRRYLRDPDLLLKDTEITAKRLLLVHNDFAAGADRSDIGLNQLVNDHPGNRMAFEYYMTSLLLTKNLKEFAANIGRIKDFGYKDIPVYFEEALLIYMNFAKVNLIPPGYGIRNSTIQRFQEYGKFFASQSHNRGKAAHVFAKYFGNTYLFYWQFINNGTAPGKSNHLFN